ncbi:hypothetical protein DFJ73DRAFT_801200 [Zopfochytrium polystomum]|nr:hypothetical protein DFJ73DRAFT_801200 [Zopfochytrium polystomum]
MRRLSLSPLLTTIILTLVAAVFSRTGSTSNTAATAAAAAAAAAAPTLSASFIDLMKLGEEESKKVIQSQEVLFKLNIPIAACELITKDNPAYADLSKPAPLKAKLRCRATSHCQRRVSEMNKEFAKTA